MQFAIKKMRNLAGMTQQQVADALDIKKPRYGDWERETREINLRDAIKLADLFHCTLDELAGRDFPATTSLAPDEQQLVDTYRSAPDGQKPSILAVSETLAGDAGKIQSVRRRIS